MLLLQVMSQVDQVQDCDDVRADFKVFFFFLNQNKSKLGLFSVRNLR